MYRYPIFAVLCLLVGLATWGCGSDDKGIQPTVTAAEKYEALQFPLGEVFDYAVEQLRFDPDGLDNFDPYGGGLGRLASTGIAADTIIHVYHNGWHIINATIGFEYGNMTIVDSIRFTNSQGQPQEVPGRETTAAMHIIDHWDLTYNLEPWGGTSSAYVDLSYADLQSSSIIVDGTGIVRLDLTATIEEKPNDWDLTCNIDFNDVTIANPDFGGSGCADGGSLVTILTGFFSIYDDQGEHILGNVDATGTVVFNADGTADVTVAVGGSQFQDSVATCESI